jgi:UDP-glucose 4-epimerase
MGRVASLTLVETLPEQEHTQMTTALVTGGAGFMGCHVARCLLAAGREVVVLDDLSGGYRDNVPAGAHFVQGSVTDAGLLAHVFTEHNVTDVYHLAAYAAEGLSHFIRAFNYANNVVGSMHVINECVKHQVRALVFTSSIAVYGASQVPMCEDVTPQPEDPYGIAKFAVELDLKAAHHMFGLNSIVFRPHNVYGEHQNIGDRYRNVIGIFMNRIMHGEPMPVFGDGSQTRAFSYVGDIAPIIARAPDVRAAFGQVFNIGADQPYSVNELADVVAEVMGVEPRIEYLPARKEVVHAFSDHAKLIQTFGPTASTSLREGIRRMAAWVRQVGPRASQPFQNIEVTRNLPPSWVP